MTTELEPIHLRLLLEKDFLKPKPPGLYLDLPASEYHRMLGASASRLKMLSRSPAHMLRRMLEPGEPSEAMEMGTAIHARILEPEKFEREFVVQPKFHLMPGNRTAKGEPSTSTGTSFVKDSVENFQIENRGRTIIGEDALAVCEGIYDSLMENDEIKRALQSDGPIEGSIFWDDAETGVRCKGRIDKVVIMNEQHILLDPKSAKDASKPQFAKDMANLQYHIQAAMYIDGYKAATGIDVLGFAFLAVEKEPPFGFGLYLLDQRSVEAGRVQYRELLRVWKHCWETNHFPHYTDNKAESALQEISLPVWALREAGL